MHGKSLAFATTATMAALLMAACSRKPASEAAPAPAAEVAAGETAAAPATPTPSGSETMDLKKTDLAPGTGAEISSGQTALVHYTGWLYDERVADKRGEEFDSSVERGEPFTFLLGAGQVIRGWDDGVAGMKVGGQRTLTIPPDMGYGARGAGGAIPPNATLVFDVELLDVR